MKKYKLYIDRDKCIGCNTCVAMFPEVFDIDDNDGLVRAEGSKAEKHYDVLEIDESQLEEFRDLVERCPTKVFRINKSKLYKI